MQLVAALLTILSPLVASSLVMLFGASLGERVAKIGMTGLFISTGAALFSLYELVQGPSLHLALPGFPDFIAPHLLIDRLSGVMMVLVAGVSLVIHVYSSRYMQGDQDYAKFFGLLSLLTFVLLVLVTSGHLLWLFVAWHAVSWLLQTLLSFNRDSQAAREAGRTTLCVQGVGDAALLVGFGLIYATFGTFDLTVLHEQWSSGTVVPPFGEGTWWEIAPNTLITLIIALSVLTKSAQFPFHIWLPGTIEAPTPVSAMLHAGIVNAGGFLVNRLAPLYGSSPATLYLLFALGAFTALIGALTMLTQSSIKRTLVYSTMGQMGYMVMECGLGAFALAIFHLCAHGLFKATLFLNSGTNIHKARTDFTIPERLTVSEPAGFPLATWVVGLLLTLVMPLVMVLLAHGAINIPLFETQGTMIFMFFAWVTSAQAIFSLYRMSSHASWKVSATMILTVVFVGFTYLWAGESFTHFLYPAPGQAGAYFQAAAWHQGLFEIFVAVTSLAIVAVWGVLYANAHGMKMPFPRWLEYLHRKLYVAFLNALYVEDLFRTLKPFADRTRFTKSYRI
ncbi:MAG: NADH-quinone oxidoreductase subunit L [Nitrospira sp.]|nr:NADH-quinone oxidoreductase subunit L [Nitrospira sp.]